MPKQTHTSSIFVKCCIFHATLPINVDCLKSVYVFLLREVNLGWGVLLIVIGLDIFVFDCEDNENSHVNGHQSSEEEEFRCLRVESFCFCDNDHN